MYRRLAPPTLAIAALTAAGRVGYACPTPDEDAAMHVTIVYCGM